MIPLRVVSFCASSRNGSYNRKLLNIADAIVEQMGAEIDKIELRDVPLPLYNGDDETSQGLPDAVWKLKSRIAAAHGIIIACPEYNASIPGVFKNLIDWTSRGNYQPWEGKVIGLMAASSGLYGGVRMLPHLRQVFQLLNAQVIPQQVAVREARKVWDDTGKLLDEKLPGHVEKLVRELVRVATALKIQSNGQS
jgi:chromate reductase, NAD(P)H dehydrogenase (quinone)